MYIGVFNARNSEWWNGNSTNLQGTELAELEAQYSLNQIIYGPTHILPNSARFIDLIFTKEKIVFPTRGLFLRYFRDGITN